MLATIAQPQSCHGSGSSATANMRSQPAVPTTSTGSDSASATLSCSSPPNSAESIPRLNWADIYSDDDDADLYAGNITEAGTHQASTARQPNLAACSVSSSQSCSIDFAKRGVGSSMRHNSFTRRGPSSRYNAKKVSTDNNSSRHRNPPGDWRTAKLPDVDLVSRPTSEETIAPQLQHAPASGSSSALDPEPAPLFVASYIASTPTLSSPRSPLSSRSPPQRTLTEATTACSSLSSQVFEGSDISSPVQGSITGIEEDEECDAEAEDESSKLENIVNFVGLWTAWFNPPKAPGVRGGVSFDTYMEQLYEMGTIFDSRDFWTIHEQVDWENVPSGSMISFSRNGSKPCWEDPFNCNGARLVIRGFPKNFSERLFTKVCLALLLSHFPNSQSLTCASLQVKDSRRGGNAVHIWSQHVDMEQFRALEEHVLCLWQDGSNTESPRTSTPQSQRSGPGQSLRFEYCANSEAIERNICRMDGGSRVHGLRRGGSSLQASVAALAANCDVVAQLYSAGKGSKRSGKGGRKNRSRGGRMPCGKKMDWGDVLLREISSSSLASTPSMLSQTKTCDNMSTSNHDPTVDIASVGAQWSAASSRNKRKSRKRPS